MLCLDSADPELIRNWAQAGHLPTFRSLLGDASVARIENPIGLYTGAIWPSFHTGLSPARHGRYFLRRLVTGSYQTALVTAKDLKREPFWKALGAAGRRVAVVDVPKSPLVRNPNITLVADWGTDDPDPDGMRIWPESLASDLVARFGLDSVGPADPYCTPAELRQLRDGLLDRVAKKEAIHGYLLGQGDWDLYIGSFSEIHGIGHQCWHLHDAAHPRHDPALAAALGDPLLDLYRATDGALGRLIDLVGGDVPLLVYLSHGMGPRYDGSYLLDEVLRRLEGAPRLPGRGFRRLVQLLRQRLPWQALPKRLRRAGRSLSVSMEEATWVLARRHRDCFLLPFNDNCAAVRINLRGREPLGRIARGAEYDAFCEALAADLMELVDLGTGRPAVCAVHRTDRLFHGEYLDDLPDILVQWHREAPITGLASPKVGEVRGVHPGARTGDHRPEGLLMARGPGIEPGSLPAAISVYDLAPTLAAALGVTLDDVDGRPVAALAGLGAARAAAT